MKKIFLTLAAFIAALLLGSCSDFLEEKSQDEIRVQSVKDYQELVTYYMPHNCGFEYFYLLDDDIRLNDRRFDYSGPEYIAEVYYGPLTWQPDMWQGTSLMRNYYKYFYEQIMGMNAVLDGIDEAKGPKDEREKTKAEALALRGYYYFQLVNLFAEPYNHNKSALGVPLKLTADILESGIPRNTVEEVYAQILKDMEEAAEIFARYPKQHGNFRMNGNTADILLSRVYQQMERWEDVVKVCNRAIENSEGLTNYTTVPPRTLFFLPTYKRSEVEWIYGNMEMPMQFASSKALFATYESNDARRNFWFRPDGSINSQRYRTESGDDCNITIRISEAYLNRAEALILQKQKDAAGALADLVKLRGYRITGYTPENITDPEQLLDEIRLERRRELCFDGCRWFDLRRYGMPSISREHKFEKRAAWKTYTLEEKDPAYTLPIPDLMLENNVLLEQNPSRMLPAREGVIMN